MASMELKDKAILVTRPLPYGEILAEKLKKYGAHTVVFPTLEIKTIESLPFEIVSPLIKEADLIIFASQHAVSCLPLSWSNQLRTESAHPETVVISMGQATTDALEHAGIVVSFTPRKGTTSEHLLEQPFLLHEEIQGKKVLLFTGLGGRTLIEDTLRRRGAELERVPVYERLCPKIEDKRDALKPFLVAKDHAIVVTSANCLDNLLYMLKDEHYLDPTQYPLVTISQRVAEYAKENGFDRVVVAQSARDEDVIKALLNS